VKKQWMFVVFAGRVNSEKSKRGPLLEVSIK
jgi:hypothetical protein